MTPVVPPAVPLAEVDEETPEVAIPEVGIEDLLPRLKDNGYSVEGVSKRRAWVERKTKAKLGQVGSASWDSELMRGNIENAIGSVATIMRDIAAAGAAQRDEIGAVTRAIGDIDQMTQQNATLIEQAAVATESLRSEAMQLVENVRIFKLAQRR